MLVQFVLNNDQVAENTERPQTQNIGVQQDNVEQNIEGIQQEQLNGNQQQGGGQQQQEDPLLPGDLEQLLEDVNDGEFDPDLQQVLEIQHQAGVGQEQLNTQQFEDRFFVQ